MKKLKDGRQHLQSIIESQGKNFTVGQDYTDTVTKVSIVCNECNYYWKSFPSNIRKNGCPSCNKKVKFTVKALQAELDYKKSSIVIESEEKDYKNVKSKLALRCKVCEQSWFSSPESFRNTGCPHCAGVFPLSLETVQQRLDQANRNIEVSGEYSGLQNQIACECTLCGDMWSCTAGNLLSGGRSCTICRERSFGGFDINKPGYLYYLRVTDNSQTYWKIGITNLGVKARFRPLDREKISVLYCHLFENGKDAQVAERNILNMFKEYRAISVKILESGNTELFTKDVLQMNHLNWGPI